MSIEAEEEYKNLQKQVARNYEGEITIELKCQILKAFLANPHKELVFITEPAIYRCPGAFILPKSVNVEKLTLEICKENPKLTTGIAPLGTSLKYN